MNLEIFLFVGPLIASGFLTLFLAALVLRKERSSSTHWFTILMIAVSTWSLLYACEIVFLDEGFTLFFAKLKYIGIVSTPLAWFFFSVSYTKKGFIIPKKIVFVTLLMPLLTTVMLFSNTIHHLFWSEISFIGNNQFLILSAKSGIFFWGHALYLYILVILGSGFFIIELFRKKDVFTKQNLAVLIGVLSPFFGNIIVVFDLIDIAYGYDITPLLIMISGVLFYFSITYYRFLDLMPVAKDEIFNHFSEAIFVVNKDMRIVDSNIAACRLLKQGYVPASSENLIGSSIDSLFVKIFPNGLCNGVGIKSSTLQLQSNGEKKWFDVSMKPLFDTQNNCEGHLVFLEDVTSKVQAEDELRQKIDELQRFKQVTIDRELKMIELKKKMIELEVKQGRVESR